MALCGSYNCGCGITSNGSMVISGSGEPGDPYVLDTGSTEWTPYTPQVDQGATTNLAKTIQYASYARSGPTGKTIHVAAYLSVAGTGTAGSPVSVTLPFPAFSQAGTIGAGWIYDASINTLYIGLWTGVSTTQIVFASDGVAGSGWGQSPSVAMANADQLKYSFTYQAA